MTAVCVVGRHRNPIPEYYSITLEISRDRTTAAEQFVCNSKDRSLPPCPPGYNDGDVYLSRTLNEACQKMVGLITPPSIDQSSVQLNQTQTAYRDD